MLLNHKITEFWQWFASVSDRLLKNYNDGEWIEQVADRVHALHPDLDWEIGPVKGLPGYVDGPELYFCISPCLKDQLVDVTREIIKAAPSFDAWLLLSAKPEKGWFPQWGSFDASNWTYQLYQFEDGTYDMDVWVDNIVEEADRQFAVEVTVTNLLGEVRLMEAIKHIQVVSGNTHGAGDWSRLKYLKKHLEQLALKREM